MKYLSIKEAAKYLKISRPTVYKWIKQGKLLVLPVEGGADVVIIDDTKENIVNA